MRVNWIEHKENKILFVDFSNIKDQDEMINILNEYFEIVKNHPSKVLTLMDSTNATVGPGFLSEIKRLGKENSNNLDKTAIIGVTGLKTLLLKGYNAFTNLDSPAIPSPNKEEALEYLTS